MQILGYQWNGRKVLVTGASGFKGSWLCAALVRLGARVHGTVQPGEMRHRPHIPLWDLSRNSSAMRLMSPIQRQRGSW